MSNEIKEIEKHISTADIILRGWSVNADMVFQMAAVRTELKAALDLIPKEKEKEEGKDG